jgi:excisionase family DNA binding protein
VGPVCPLVRSKGEMTSEPHPDGKGTKSRPSLPVLAMDDSASPLLTVGQVAALTGLSSRAVYGAVARGELRAIRVCSRLRIRQEWFDEWLERGIVQPEPAFVMPPAPLRPGSFKALLREREGGER